MVGGFTVSLSSVGYTGKDGTHVHTYVRMYMCAYLDRDDTHTHTHTHTRTTRNTGGVPHNTKHYRVQGCVTSSKHKTHNQLLNNNCSQSESTCHFTKSACFISRCFIPLCFCGNLCIPIWFTIKPSSRNMRQTVGSL